MGLVTYFSSNFAFYVYSQVVNDPTNHRYRIDSQAVLKVKTTGFTTVGTDWVSIVVAGVTHKVYLAMKYRGIGNHTLYSRSDYFSYDDAARTISVNAHADIDGKLNIVTGRTYGPGVCTGYANYESLPAKYPTTNIDLVKGAYDNDSIVATCKGIVANRGYGKTVRWYVNNTYKAEDHLAEGTVECSNTFTGLAAGASHDIRARVYYRYAGNTDYDIKLQEKEESWSTAALVVSGGLCVMSGISKTQAKITLSDIERNYSFAVEAKVYLGGVLKSTIAMASGTTSAAYTFTGLTPDTAYSAQVKVYTTGGTLLKTYTALAFRTQVPEVFLTEDAVLAVSVPALGSVKFSLTNIKRNIPFGVRVEYTINGTTNAVDLTDSATAKSYTRTGLPIEDANKTYTVKLINDGTDEVLQTITGNIDLAYVMIDYSDYYKTDLTRTSCTFNITDIVFETVPAGLPCVLSFDCNGESSYQDKVLCTMQDVPVVGDTIRIPITNWDFEESADLSLNWKANGIVCWEDSIYDSGIILYAGSGISPEMLNLHQTGGTVYLPGAIAKYAPEDSEAELMNPEDLDADGLAVFPGVFDILWHVLVYDDATGALVKYVKVGPEHGEVFTYILTGLKPNTTYRLQLGNAPVCRSYDYQGDWYTDPNEITFTTENYALVSRTLSVVTGSPLGLTFIMDKMLGNSAYPMKFKLYIDDVLRLTTGEVPLDLVTSNRCWMFVDGFSKGTTVSYKVEAIECVTNSIVETFTGSATTWTEAWLAYIALSTATNYWLVNVNTLALTEGNYHATDLYPREHVFPEIQLKFYFRPSLTDPTQPVRLLFERYSRSDTEYIPYDDLTYGTQGRYEMTDAYLPDEDGYVIINKQNFPALGKYCWKPVQMFICDPETNEIVRSVTDLYLSTGRLLGPSGGDVNVDIPEV